MTKRIFVGIILVSFITVLACTGLVMGVMYDYLGEKIDDELKDEAKIVEASLKINGVSYLKQLNQTNKIDSRITLIAPSGDVIFDSEANSGEMVSHFERKEVKEALSDGEGYAVRKSDTLAQDTRYYAIRMEDGNILRLSSNHYSQVALIADNFGIVFLIIIVLIVVGIIISARITRSIVRPINNIDLDSPDISKNYEEIIPLLHRIREQNNKIHIQMEKLKKQQNEFAVIMENMSEGLIVVDKDMEVLACNNSAVNMLDAKGYNKNENILGLNRSQAFRCVMSRSLEGENCRDILSINGFIYEVIANPVYDGECVTGTVLIIIDVTEKEKGELLRREFTSNVSHELKTPLTTIYGIADMMSGDLVKSEDIKPFANTIKEESSRLVTLIEDVLRLSQLDENNVQDEKESVDVLNIAEKVAKRLAHEAGKRGVKVGVSGSHVRILGISSMIEEIIYNLCDNSIKYNKEGGTVQIKVDKIDDYCLISVEDSGIGIPKKHLNRVFERFYRVDKSRSKVTGGTGLGLSIVKHSVSYLGGELSIDSDENLGTKVNIRFKSV